MRESNGRSRQIRCWKLDMNKGQILEYGKYAAPTSFDDDPSYPPTISVTADDEQMTKIISSKVDLKVAELLGQCQLKWGDDSTKRDLSRILTQLNNIPSTFMP